jgi:hypothetical protein
MRRFAGCSIRRLNPAKEHCHWHPGRISHRVCGTVCHGCASLNHQPTNPARTSQGCQRGDASQTLPGTRIAGYFSQPETNSRNLRRGAENLFNAVCLPDLPEQLDSSTMEVLPHFRRQSGGRGSLAKNSSIGSRKQGQNPQHHERFVFSRHPLGVGRQESDHECTPKCKTLEDTGRSHAPGDYGSSREVAGTTSDGGRDRCLHWVAPRGADRTSMARCEFRDFGHSRSPFNSHDGPRFTENGGLRKRRSAGRSFGRVFWGFSVLGVELLYWRQRRRVLLGGRTVEPSDSECCSGIDKDDIMISYGKRRRRGPVCRTKYRERR